MFLGLDDDFVKVCEMLKSIGIGKMFRGALAICFIASVKYWFVEFIVELNDWCEVDEEEWNCVLKLLILGFLSLDECEMSSGYCSRRCFLRFGADEMV